MYTPYFGLIDFTKQLKKYRPEIEQISDQEKIITIQNPNPNEETEIMFDLNRENFYFPFTLEFSQIPILLNINEKCIHVHPKELLNNKDFKKMTFSPRTNTIFFHSPESVDFNYVSIIKFKLRPFQEIENSVVTFKFKVEKPKKINLLQKKIQRKKIFLCVGLLLVFFLYTIFLYMTI